MPDVREVHANLVGASGLQLHAHVTVMPEVLLNAVVRHRLATAPRHHRHFGAFTRVAANRRIDGAAGDQRPLGDGVVLPLHAARGQLVHQRRVRLKREGNHQQAAGVLVEPVHDAGTRNRVGLGKVMQQRILQRAITLTGARMDGQSGRFVDHRHIRVGVHDLQRHLLRCYPVIGQRHRIELDHATLGHRFA